MRNRKIIFFILALILCIAPIVGGGSAYAKDLPVSIDLQLPENQQENISGYFSLKAKDNSLKQRLSIELANNTNMKKVIDIDILNAYSSPNGVIQYLDGGSEKASFSIINESRFIYEIEVVSPTEKIETVKVNQPHLIEKPSNFFIDLPIEFNSPFVLKNAELNYAVSLNNEKLFTDRRSIDFAPMSGMDLQIPYEFKEIKEEVEYNIKGKLIYLDKNNEKNTEEFDFDFMYSDNENTMINNAKHIVKATMKYKLSTKALCLLWIVLIALMTIILVMRKKG